MSVDIESLIIDDGQDSKQLVKEKGYPGSVKFRAGDIRDLNLWIGYDPECNNPYHGQVWGNPRHNHFTQSQKKNLRKISKWHVKINNAFIV